MTKSLRNKVPSDQVTKSCEGRLTSELLWKEVPESLSDAGDDIIHGELYLDSEGRAHFICHTPGNMTFVEVREALSKFIDLFLDQIERQEECPFSNGGGAGGDGT